jgi:hypothetical protein
LLETIFGHHTGATNAAVVCGGLLVSESLSFSEAEAQDVPREQVLPAVEDAAAEQAEVQAEPTAEAAVVV